jgi:hypothetical protein
VSKHRREPRSRREFLAAVGGLAAGTAAGLGVAPRRASAGSGAARCRPPAGHARLAGYTVNPRTYGMTDWVAAARRTDAWLGMPLAVTMQKAYLGEGELPAKPGRHLSSLAGAGCQFLVSAKPSRQRSRAERDRLRGWVRGLKAAGIRFRVILWQECNDQSFFGSAAEWLGYWAWYAPAVQAEGVRCVYDPGANPWRCRRALDWFPTEPLPDELRIDYYGNAWVHGARPDALLGKAADHKVPAGLGEWGATASRPITAAQWDAYCDYLTGLAPHLALGGVYYGSVHQAARANVVESGGDHKVGGIRAVSAALAAGRNWAAAEGAHCRR